MNTDTVTCGGPGYWMTPGNANFTGGLNAAVTPDTGTVTASIGGTNYTVSYGGSDTPSTIATNLASAISAGSLANASASGGTINLTAKTSGPGEDFSLAASYTWNSSQFTNASFTTSTSGSTFTGGYNPGDPANRPFVTQYSYDGLGNLLTVTQKGDPTVTNSSQWRVRNFTYDTLSRLLTAQNPESGTINYAYDADGNLLQKTSPAPNSQVGSGATQIISYCYDALNRVTGKAYSAQSCPLSSPVVTYAYDSGANAIGKLTSLNDQAGPGSYTYDVLGRQSDETRSLAGVTKSMSYTYNLDGSLKTLTNPSGAVITYTPWNNGTIAVAGLDQSAADSGNGINYVTSGSYGPDLGITAFISGQSSGFNGVTNSFSYNNRLQPVTMSAASSSATVFSLTYNFNFGAGDNGNVIGIANNKDNTRNQSFTYDSLNRLTSAQNAGTNCTTTTVNGKTEYWGNTYGYDAWGNLVQKAVTKCSAENLTVTAAANNQLSGYGYDAAGNMTSDPTDGVTATYDQENRITGAGGYTYTYDADGNRVEKSSGGTGTLYWYMSPGIVAESDLSGNLKSEYVFFDGERVARRDGPNGSGGVFYYFSDHLRTTDLVTNATGTILNESDFYPWGGELQFAANDSNHYKFTGKERDGETGLDYLGARYYSNGLGRFTTPDWALKPTAVPYAEFADPQSLNLYTYVRNIPTTRVDLDGHFADPFNTFGGGGLFDDSDGGSNIESSHDHLVVQTVTTTTRTFHLPSLDGATSGPTIVATQEDVTERQVGVTGQNDYTVRGLNDYEKSKLGPYVPKDIRERAVLYIGKVPFWLKKNADAVTLHDNIYIRKGVYDSSSLWDMGELLAHELFHVDQFARGWMTERSYIVEAVKHGTDENSKNKYEQPAYRFGHAVREHLLSHGTAWDGSLIP